MKRAVASRRRLLGSLAAVPIALRCSNADGEPSELPLKLTVMLWTVSPNLPIEQRIDQIFAAGYRSIELVTEFTMWSDDDFRRIISKMRTLGMGFDTLGGNRGYTQSKRVGLTDPRDRTAFIASIGHALDAARRLECPTIIVFSGRTVDELPQEQQHKSIVEGLKRAADMAAKQNTTLLLENIDLEEDPHYYLWNCIEGFKIIGEVNHPSVKFLYDCYHAQISEGNLITTLDHYIDYIGLVHVADVPGRHEPGTGEINFLNIFRKLIALKYRGYVAMEFRPTHDPVQSLREARNIVSSAARTY